MKLRIIAAACAVALSTMAANAATLFTDANGNVVNGIAQDAFTFTETASNGMGTYTFTNNLAGAKVWGFGISNPDPTLPMNNNTTSCCGEAFPLTSGNWGTAAIDFYNNRTGLSIFGAFADIIGDDLVFNFYQDIEVGYGSGTHTGFDFFFGDVASNLFVIAEDANGQALYARTVTSTPAVPLPAGGLLLLSALGAGAFLRRKKA